MPHAHDLPEPSFAGEKVYVPVGTKSRATLQRALHKFPKAPPLCWFMSTPSQAPGSYPFTPMLCAVGTMIPTSLLEELELIGYKKMELQRINDSLDQYLLFCAQEKVQAEKLVADQMRSFLSIMLPCLSWGQQPIGFIQRKVKVLKSNKTLVVQQQADPFCKIWFICKGTLVYRRYGVLFGRRGIQLRNVRLFSDSHLLTTIYVSRVAYLLITILRSK